MNLACVGAAPLGARQLPELRQPRAPRGDVAAVRGHRRHGRGVPGARRSRSSAATSRSTTSPAAPTSTRRRWSAWSGSSTSLERRPPGMRPGRRARRSCCSARRPTTLSGSAWAWSRGHHRGTPPTVDLDRPPSHGGRLRARRWSPPAACSSVHDLAGGFGPALAEMAVASECRRHASTLPDARRARRPVRRDARPRCCACVARRRRRRRARRRRGRRRAGRRSRRGRRRPPGASATWSTSRSPTPSAPGATRSPTPWAPAPPRAESFAPLTSELLAGARNVSWRPTGPRQSSSTVCRWRCPSSSSWCSTISASGAKSSLSRMK